MTLRSRFTSSLALATAATALAVLTPTAAHAATPVCKTLVGAVRADNKIVFRRVEGETVTQEKVSEEKLSFGVNALLPEGSVDIDGGVVRRLNAITPGQRPHLVSVSEYDHSTVLHARLYKTYSNSFSGRNATTSSSYYIYAVGADGHLKRWTRYRDRQGNLWLADPVVVLRNQSSIKAMTFAIWFDRDGHRRDVLYATTKGGWLKQFQIPHEAPTKVKVTALVAQGFASYTGLSSSICNDDYRHMSLIAVDRVSGRARWFTMASQTAPKGDYLVRRGLVGDGLDWNIHAVL